jgi:hypothetical protein
MWHGITYGLFGISVFHVIVQEGHDLKKIYLYI